MRLELSGIGKRYGEAWAIRDLSLVVPERRIAVLLGHNGAGKSTTLRLAVGIVRPTHGCVRIDGVPIDELGTGLRRSIGYLPEEAHLLSYLSAREYLSYVGQLHGIEDEAALDATVSEAMARLGLTERAEGRIGELSAGLRRRVSIASALLNRPGLLLLDEPTNFLDPIGVKLLKDLFVRLRAEGAAILLATHRLDVAEQLADDVVVIEQGRPRFQGTLTELRSRFGAGVTAGSLEEIYAALVEN